MTERAPAEQTGSDPAVRVENLSKRYGDPETGFLAVDGVTLDIEAGTVVGILGPNGAGKTTLIKSMLGLVVPTSGTVELAGADVATERAAVYEHVGAMLEGARNVYWRLSIRENLEFFAALAAQSPKAVRERHDELLDRFDLREKADEPVKELSRGMKQKVSLASTLSRGGSILFLDEPTLGLDVESSVELRRELRDLVDRESKTVVLSSHDMDVIEELCDRVVIMNEGEVIADDTVENLTDVFASQAYSVTMDGRLPERTRREIERGHAVEEFERTPDGNDRFEVVLDGGDALYELVGTLSESGVGVASIDASQPDLETAFLELIGDAGDGANPSEDGDRTAEPSTPDEVAQ